MLDSARKFFGLSSGATNDAPGSAGNNPTQPGTVAVVTNVPGPIEVLNNPAEALRIENPFAAQTRGYLASVYLSGAMLLDSERGEEVSNKEMLATLIADCEKFQIHKLLLSSILTGSGTASLLATVSAPDQELHFSNVITFTTCKVLDQKAQPIQLRVRYCNESGTVPNGGEGTGNITVMPTTNTVVGIHRVGYPLSGEFQAEVGILSSFWRGTTGVYNLNVDVNGASNDWTTQIMLLPTKHPLNRMMMNAATAIQMGEAIANILTDLKKK